MFKSKRKIALCAAPVLAVAMLVGAPAAMAGKADDTLIWSTSREIDVAVPYYTTARVVFILGRHAWDSLIYRDPVTFEYKPLLATSWTWRGDLALELELRKGVKFHDGSDFNADDVVATFNHVVKEDSGVVSRRSTSWIKNAEKLGDYKVRINLEKPFPAALEFLAGPLPIYPSGIWSTAQKDNTGKPDYGTIEPIGTGPYKIDRVVPGERVEMSLNADYWDGSPKGKPSIGRIVFKTIPDPEAQVAQILTGEVDLIWEVPKGKAADLAKSGRVQLVNEKTFRVSHLSFDVAGRSGTDRKENPAYDLKVRQAIAHAIDREAIAKQLVGKASVVIHSACYPTQLGCTQDVPKYEYDPGKAMKILTEAGYPDGLTIDLYAYRDREFTEAVIGYLAAVGIKVDLKYLKLKTYAEIRKSGKGGFMHGTWGSSSLNDASAITSVMFKHGARDYCRDPDVKDWLDVADTSIDPKVRKEHYKKALVRIQEKLCWLPMFTYTKNYVFSNDLDFTPTNDEIPRLFAAKWK